MPDHRDDQRRFDPRFDPKFQPGYDVRNDPAAAARSTARFAPAAVQAGVQVSPFAPGAPVTRAAPVTGAAPVVGAAPVRRPTTPDETGVRPGEAAADVALDDRTEGNEASARQGRNPFIVALWIVAGLLMLAGVATAQFVRDLALSTQTSSEPALTYTDVQVAIALTPLLFILSIATAVGLIFLHAVNWSRRT